MTKAAGIDPGKVEFVPAAPPVLPQLLVSGQVDAIIQLLEQAEAIPAGSLRPADLVNFGLVPKS